LVSLKFILEDELVDAEVEWIKLAAFSVDDWQPTE